MTRILELNQETSCFNRAESNEPMFILLGRDPVAAMLIREWCKRRLDFGKNKFDDAQILEALRLADRMDDFRQERNARLLK